MSHLQQRLSERKINYPTSKLFDIAKNCKTDTAVVLLKLDGIQNDSKLSFYDRTESNGDLVILIVRNQRPCTIMYRRSNQKMTPDSMKVNNVISYLQ